jgi:gluconokinase
VRRESTGKGSKAIIVMGVSGSGKSTFGRQLATHWSVPFLEGDEFHPPSNVEKMRIGVPLTDDDRWPWLDRIAQAFAADCERHSLVVGSCSALRRAYRDRLRGGIPVPVLFVFLEADEHVLLERVKSRRGHYMPPALLPSQLATLERPDPDEHALFFQSDQRIERLIAQVDAQLRAV